MHEPSVGLASASEVSPEIIKMKLDEINAQSHTDIKSINGIIDRLAKV